uniref:TRUD domain-containing protein n=1 Tax=Spumella elongata TaxID=89044 RepID=A0A7S3HDG6_9STRA
MDSADGDDHAVEAFDELVGITEFANSSKSINGILKQRYSDFIVREISIKGEVSYLRDLSGKELEDKYFGKGSTNDDGAVLDSTEAKATSIINNIFEINADLKVGLDVEALTAFLVQCINSAEDCPPHYNAFPDLDKVTRTAVHKLLKGSLPDNLETVTVQVEGKSMIQMLAKHKNLQNAHKRKRAEWPSGLGNFLKFTLLKENIDTMSAVTVLNNALRCGSTGVTYSGTKDKRGVTAQKCTVYRRKPSDFTRINASNMTPTICCGDFEYVDEQAVLGDGGGNRFEIVLRALNTTVDAEIVDSCTAMQKSGFINYFGLQRFGKGGTKSHEFGKAILKADWEGCVDMLFTPRAGDRHNIARAKELYAEKDFTGALKTLPEAMFAEKCVLQKLVAKPTDFLGAYNSIQKNARLICAHAYQSYLWNKATSRRLKLHGANVIVGDLVLVSGSNGASGAVAEQNASESSSPVVSVVTVEDVASQRYTMEDVVLPLPGYESIYPENDIGTYYDELLAADGLTRRSYDDCHPAYREKGVYRRLVQYPKDFEWQVIAYDDPDAELATTEINQFRVARPSSKPADAETESKMETSAPASAEPVATASAGKYRALLVKFSLPPGTYATMLLRELTKSSTESGYQAQLSKESIVVSAPVVSVEV